MILFPRAWTLDGNRLIVAWAAWALLALGCLTVYGEACPDKPGEGGWGGLILIWFAAFVLVLLAVAQPGLTAATRGIRLLLGAVLLFPGILILVAMLKEALRSTCVS